MEIDRAGGVAKWRAFACRCWLRPLQAYTPDLARSLNTWRIICLRWAKAQALQAREVELHREASPQATPNLAMSLNNGDSSSAGERGEALQPRGGGGCIAGWLRRPPAGLHPETGCVVDINLANRLFGGG